MEEALRIERQDQQIGAVLRNIPLHWLPVPFELRQKVVCKRYSDKKKFSARPNVSAALPDYFLFECYNPNPDVVNMTFTAWSKEANEIPPRRFQHLVEAPSGFSRHEILTSEIVERIDLRKKFGLTLVPNEVADPLTLFFGTLAFVKDSRYDRTSPSVDAQFATKCKCIVWDLDNTMWSGVLIEDGLESVSMKPGMVELLKHFDERGILHSIASKNNPDEAMQALKHFGIDHYFLCPQISWDPKSAGVREIARQLNIGLDTMLFVDDQIFERKEVATVVPE
ncbi:MAG: HAD-IIIC family phosphatase, partial [Aeoliella sp.]